MNDVAIWIIGMNTKKNGQQLRRFDKAYQGWHSQEAREMAWTSKGPSTLSEPQ